MPASRHQPGRGHPSHHRAGHVLLGVVALAAAACAGPATTTGGSTGGSSAATPPGSTAPAPGGAGTSAPTPTRAPGPLAFSTETRVLIDTSRPTEAGAQTPAAPERRLPTVVRIPEGGGRRPLIVFSHGLWGHPDKFTDLLDRWAAAGFVVAAPAFPLTNDDVPGAPQNWTGLASQPGDVSFVIDQLLAANGDAADALHERIDPTRIGAGGLSLGGATTYGVTFNDCCRDDRIAAAMVLSGALLPPGGGEPRLDGHVPLLIIHGDADAALPYRMAVEAFDRSAAPTWFVTFSGGTHAPPFEDDPSPFDALADQLTTLWWEAELAGVPGALDEFEAAAVVPGSSSLQAKRR